MQNGHGVTVAVLFCDSVRASSIGDHAPTNRERSTKLVAFDLRVSAIDIQEDQPTHSKHRN